jgi:hypothetical protein
MAVNKPLRPRWGTFSVVDHRNLVALTPEVLLYDKLVFPAPTDDDWDRWEEQGWKPELQERRLNQLGDLVHRVLWTKDWEKKWSDTYQQLKAMGNAVEGLAVDATPMVLAMSAWEDRVPPPIAIAAFQQPVTAMKFLGLSQGGVPQEGRAELHRQVCALFERLLEMPVLDNPEEAFEKAVELAHDARFQQARRSLFEWEDKRVADGWPPSAAIKELAELIKEYNALTKGKFINTTARNVFYLVELVSSELTRFGVKVVTLPHAGEAAAELTGAAAGEGVKFVFSSLKPYIPFVAGAAKPGDSPAEAAHLAIRAMYHDSLATGE